MPDNLGRRWSQALESLGIWWVRTRAGTNWYSWEYGTADHPRPAARCDGSWLEPPAARPAAVAVGLPERTAHPARTPGAAPGGRGTGCAWRSRGHHPRSPLSDHLGPFALTAYKEMGQGYSLSQSCWDHTGLQSLINWQGQDTGTRRDRQARAGRESRLHC